MGSLSPTEARWVRQASYAAQTPYVGCRWDRAPKVFEALVKRGVGRVEFGRDGRGRPVKRFALTPSEQARGGE